MESSGTKTPLVSIVINNYNYGRFLKDAIESALGQIYPLTEVIVVDDGSTDDSREVIAGYGERVRALFKENGGQASAFNAGFALTKGDVVIFLDADDLLLPHAVERAIAVWKPELSKVQWRLQLVTEDLRPLPATWPGERPMPSGNFREVVLKWGYYPSPPTSGNAFSRWFLEKILPMPEAEWRIAADSYLLTLAAVYGEVVSIDEVLGYYRLHGGNFWYLGEEDAEKLERKLIQQLKINRLQKTLRQNHVIDERTRIRVYANPLEAKAEMAASLLFPQDPSLRASRGLTALRGIWAAARFPYMPSFWSRLRLALWFLLTALLPRPIAKKLAFMGIYPGSRPKWLVKLFRVAGKLGSR
ncbi:glycosyl transferase [Thermus thermophilus]|uniref:glycosyltransferase family 2 protein n=1 Tax=Thermus thermophilus TaxID=274 RepID=UPI00090A5896|nr:glycosyltransferase [Thermus thermophilus]BAW01134.1 glycosyl transferase [Thermus thermophilus]BDB11801.1 glycosyl transferase [Thermus thermophilus]